MTYPIPLVAPDVLWLSHGADIAPALNEALTRRLKRHDFQVRDLDTAGQALLRAQAVFHDIRTLFREIDSVTGLWALSKGHYGAVIIGLAEYPTDNAGLGFTALGVPLAPGGFRLFTLHKHLHSDWPAVVSLYRQVIADALPQWDIAVTGPKLERLQAEADRLTADGILPGAISVSQFALQDADLACTG